MKLATPYTDEQLSAILSSHAAGLLHPRAPFDDLPQCLCECACDKYHAITCAAEALEPDRYMYDGPLNEELDWFFHDYELHWTPEEMLAALEEAGLAG